MAPTTFLLGAAAVVGLVIVVVALRAKAARRNDGLVVVFELQLPSKWAAELTAQTLANDGMASRVIGKDAGWRCYVTKRMGSDRSRIEATCRTLNQVAAARGGGCAAHRLKLGSKTQTFEH